MTHGLTMMLPPFLNANSMKAVSSQPRVNMEYCMYICGGSCVQWGQLGFGHSRLRWNMNNLNKPNSADIDDDDEDEPRHCCVLSGYKNCKWQAIHHSFGFSSWLTDWLTDQRGGGVDCLAGSDSFFVCAKAILWPTSLKHSQGIDNFMHLKLTQVSQNNGESSTVVQN